jgi:hypothetical protein
MNHNIMVIIESFLATRKEGMTTTTTTTEVQMTTTNMMKTYRCVKLVPTMTRG